MWLFAIIDHLFGIDSFWWGTYPRSIQGLKGILLSPLLHSGFSHLLSNSVPFMVSGTFIVYFFKNVSFKAFGWMYLLTGVLVWMFARNITDSGHPVYHIGASGVVYAMVAFILFSGFFVRNRLSIVLSLVMVLLYSGMIQGILPNQEGISWESHLIGAVVGALVASFYKKEIKLGHRAENWDDAPPTPEEPKSFFLDRSTFEKTKYERHNEAEENENGV
ncbi:MAG: rhomboid family intramembrane serine protease [Saprospiraceae bacterium]